MAAFDLRQIGGHPLLDLVNTVAPRAPGGNGTDFLAEPEALLTWATGAGLLDDTEARRVAHAWAARPATAREALRSAIEVREAAFVLLAGFLDAGAGAPSDDEIAHAETVLAGRRAAAAARSELRPGAGELAARLVVGTVPESLLPDRLADLAVDFLCTAPLGRLQACPLEEGGCGWLFLDLSRNRSRRWCSMAECGSQVKSRRLTARRRMQPSK